MKEGEGKGKGKKGGGKKKKRKKKLTGTSTTTKSATTTGTGTGTTTTGGAEAAKDKSLTRQGSNILRQILGSDHSGPISRQVVLSSIANKDSRVSRLKGGGIDSSTTKLTRKAKLGQALPPVRRGGGAFSGSALPGIRKPCVAPLLPASTRSGQTDLARVCLRKGSGRV